MSWVFFLSLLQQTIIGHVTMSVLDGFAKSSLYTVFYVGVPNFSPTNRNSNNSHKMLYLLHPGAGTINSFIISSLMAGGSLGGGGHTSESIISSVTRIIPTRSGGSVRDDLKVYRVKHKTDI